MSDNYDDYDFVPTSNSSLASLFDSSGGELSDNASLIYTAPKQPKKPSIEPRTNDMKPESKIICALVATVWKWCDGKYESLGKLGVAVIGAETIKSYELIVYKTRTNVIVQIRINQNFEVILNRDNFLTFYDNTKQNWLIKFNTDKDITVITENIERYGGRITRKSQESPKTNENAQELIDNKIEENRADILTRIAKLGQSILPGQDLKTNNEDDDSLRTDHDVASISSSIDDRNNQLITPSQTVQTPKTLPNSIQLPTTTSFVMSNSISYDPIGMLFTENRTNHNEVRLNLNQITDKLNQILQVVNFANNSSCNNNNSSNTNEEFLKSKIKVLQLKIENLNREIEQNSRQYAELQQKYDEQQTIIDNLRKTPNGNLIEKQEVFVGKIKEAMSDMYDDIRGNLETNHDPQIIAQNIKQTTKRIVQQYQEIHKLP